MAIGRKVTPDVPLLSALVLGTGGGPVPFFRDILKAAGLAAGPMRHCSRSGIVNRNEPTRPTRTHRRNCHRAWPRRPVDAMPVRITIVEPVARRTATACDGKLVR